MKTYGVPKTSQVGTWYEIPRQHNLQLRPQKRTWRKRIWDKPNSEILKRTPRSWALILLAYLLFYLLIIIFSTFCWFIYYSTVSLQLPRTLKTEPGLTLEPICAKLTRQNNIEYNPSHSGEVKCYVERIETFLNKYGNMRNFGECNLANNYGYKSQTPCIFLKINHMFGFKLNAIEKVSEMPKTAPKELRAHLSSLTASEGKKKLWISCESSQKSAKMQYFPKRSINSSVMEIESGDAENSKKYSDVDFERIIAVHISNIPLNKNVKIKCNIWSKNLQTYSYVNIKIKTSSTK